MDGLNYLDILLNDTPPKNPVYNIHIGDNSKILTNVEFDGCQYHAKGNQMEGIILRNSQRNISLTPVDPEDGTTFHMYYCMVLNVHYDEELDETTFAIYERTYAEVEEIKLKARLTWIELNFPSVVNIGDDTPSDTYTKRDRESDYAKQIRTFFDTGFWGCDHVKLAVQNGFITEEDYFDITGQLYS